MKALAFRDFVEKLRAEGKLVELKKPASLNLELAGVLAALDGKPVYTEKVKETPGARVAGNLFSTRELICDYFGIKNDELMPKLIRAINNPSKPSQVPVGEAPVLEVAEAEVDLGKLPIPLHAPKDGGPYFSSAIVSVADKELGQNCSFHRMMVIGKDTVAARILKRHLDEFISRAGGELPVAVVVGAPINLLLAAATSVEIGKDEMEIAASLAPLRAVRLQNGNDLGAMNVEAFLGRLKQQIIDKK